MKSKKFEKTLKLKKMTIANLNNEEMGSVLGGNSSCPCIPAPSDDCEAISQGGSCVPDPDA